jgi:hypothetical protein
MSQLAGIAVLIVLALTGAAVYYYFNPHHLPHSIRSSIPGFQPPEARSPMTNFRPPQF